MIQNSHDKKFETFNDGIVEIYNVRNIAEPGNKPVDGLILKKKLRFSYRSVGMQRQYEAMQYNVQIDDIINVMRQSDISTEDIAVINNVQYEINHVQNIKKTLPPVSRLTLTKLVRNYDIKSI